MAIVKDISEIKEALSLVEDSGEEWHTNLLEADDELDSWIRKEQLHIFSTEGCVFLYRKRYGCRRLYFACSNVSKLKAGLRTVLTKGDGKVIIKILTRKSMQSVVEEEILQAGFRYYTSLNRVVKINSATEKKCRQGDFACEDDMPRIREIINNNFDNLLDQWPDDDEIIKAINDKRILVIRDKETNQVIAIQSFQKVGMTLYGRYLASLQEYRDRMAYGPILWRQCIKQNCDVKRIVGWIDERNELAIKVNRAMGFEFDGVNEKVFVYE